MGAIGQAPDPDVSAEPFRRMRMVGWYDPGQLFRTGLEVLVSTLFGKHSDSRRIDALSTDRPLVDYTQASYRDPDGSFGFDYVADTGDGWNSTYAVAYALSQPNRIPVNSKVGLPRGRLLILGGDLVYPYPTRAAYQSRLLAPYSMAGYVHRTEPLEVLAIPGNHDWYDSLVNFRRLFCYGGVVGHRQTRQTRSYFAAHLPGNWWLFGVDLQLDHDVDQPQFKFFAELTRTFGERDRVILCVAEPVWQNKWTAEAGTFLVPTLLGELVAALGSRLRVSIAGDLHHYQRHSSKDGRHLIVCGTGGAFLHPTHCAAEDPTGTFVAEQSFPTPECSQKLTFRNLRFVTRNALFGIVPAIAYLLAAWQNGLAVGECFGHVCIGEMGEMGLSRLSEAIIAGIHSALLSPTGMALYGIIFWGFVFFADRRSSVFRYTVGPLHAACHVVAGFLVYWFAAYTAITLLGRVPKAIDQYLVAGTIILVLGWIVGSVILGSYLLLSLNVFGMHRNEAFSSLRIQDWKGFLRCRIDASGKLALTFVGFEKIPRRWRSGPPGAGAILRPRQEADLAGKVVDHVEVP